MDVNPQMIALARKARGLTQADLAARVGVTQALLSRIEGGLRTASGELLQRLSEALHYPPSFFCQPGGTYVSGVSFLYHRKRQSVPSRLLDQIHARISIYQMHLKRLLEAVELPPCRIRAVDLNDFESVQDVVRSLRAAWGIPPGPIYNLTRTIEDLGGIVIPFDFGTSAVDAVSQWPPGLPPLFFVNTRFPGDRLRFTLAHELAHVVLHQEEPHPGMEAEADQFAAELLMPERDIKPYLVKVDLPTLANLKLQWKVSMAALLKRASDLGTITENQARWLWQKMAKAGYRRREPPELDIPPEEPTLFHEIIEAYRVGMGYTDKELARLLHLHEDEVRHLYGSRAASHLRIVK